MVDKKQVKKIVRKVLNKEQRQWVKSKLPEQISNLAKPSFSEQLDKKREKYRKEIRKSEQKKLREYYASRFDDAVINENQIMYETRDGASFTDSPRAIFDYLVSNSKYAHFTHLIVVDRNKVSGFSDIINNMPSNARVVYRNSYEYMDGLLESKYLFNNSTFQSFFIKRKNQKYINTWHGTPLKKMGLDFTQANPKDMNNVRRNFLMSDFLLSPNSHVSDMFLRAYQLNGAWNGEVLQSGLPRLDRMQDIDTSALRSSLKTSGVSINDDKKNIIYMPTWQGTSPQNVDESQAIIDQLLQFVDHMTMALGKEYNILLKVHPFQYGMVKDTLELSPYLIPDSYDANDILRITDRLITDFSSVFFDYLVTNKPIYFYNWNADLYDDERGVYFTEEQLPGPVSHTLPQLIDQLTNDISLVEVQTKYADWKNRFTSYDDGNATERYVAYIFDNENVVEVIKPENGKKKLLFFRGRMGNNGITNSLVNLVNNIDSEKYDITTLLLEPKEDFEFTNIAKLNPNIRNVFYGGAADYTLDEYAIDAQLKGAHVESEIDKYFPDNAYRREARRLLGNQSYDVAIDYSGYSYFFAKYILGVKSDKKLIWLHNDIFEEVKERGQYAADLKGTLALYKKFDTAVSVSKAVMMDNSKKLAHYLSTTDQDFLANVIETKADQTELTDFEDIKLIHTVLSVKPGSLQAYDTKQHIKSSGANTIIISDDKRYYSTAEYQLNALTYIKLFEDDIYVGWVLKSEMDTLILSTESLTAQSIHAVGTLKNLDNYTGFLNFETFMIRSSGTLDLMENQVVEVDQKLIFNDEIFYRLSEYNYIVPEDVLEFHMIQPLEKPETLFINEPDGNNLNKNTEKAYFKSELAALTIFTNKNLHSTYLGNVNVFKSLIFDIVDKTIINNERFVHLKWQTKNIGWVNENDVNFVPKVKQLEMSESKIGFTSFNDGSVTMLDSKDIVASDFVEMTIHDDDVYVSLHVNNQFGEIKLGNNVLKQDMFDSYILMQDVDDTLKKGSFVFVKTQNISRQGISYTVVYNGREQNISFKRMNVLDLETPRNMDLIKQSLPISYFVKLKNMKHVYEWGVPNTLQKGQPKVETKILANQVFKVSNEYTSTNGSKYYELVQGNRVIGYTNKDFITVMSFDDYDSQPKHATEKDTNLLTDATKKTVGTNDIKLSTNKKAIGLIEHKNQIESEKPLQYTEITRIDGQVFYNVNGQLLPQDDFSVLYSQYLNDLSVDIAETDFVFSTSGRLSPEKNHKHLIYAMKNIVNMYGSNIKLVIMGEGILKDELAELILSLGLQNNVYLVGQQKNVVEVLKQSDAYVFPSIYEGQGMALLEALSLGLPAVGTNISTTLEILDDEKYGVISNGLDENALTIALSKLLSYEGQFEQFDENEYNNNVIQKFYKILGE